MINRIVLGRGNKRQAFTVGNLDPERVAEDVKNLTVRKVGATRGFYALNGAQ